MTKKKTIFNKKVQKSAKLGGIIDQPGSTKNYKTGNWVNKTLEFVAKNCINCTLCWTVCPDEAIILDENGNMIGVNTDFCKDCGLCTQICPANKNSDESKHALVMHQNKDKEF